MKVIDRGHTYFLENFDDSSGIGQVLHFIHKEPDVNRCDPEMVVVRDGTTNEEVIKVLIDRLRYLDELAPCRENFTAIKGLQMALDSLEERTRNRVKRNVEGTNKL